ncbi:MAG: DUF3426 domain-containing protein [Ramlibacter sp.]|nr:DUF3426 domain-containing protein [Ramlibacter sp.]
MSLITRCPACGTMFKVVPDQLRISEGWVRCGQCAEIFDATANLQEPEATPASAPAPVAMPVPAGTGAPVAPQAPAMPQVPVTSQVSVTPLAPGSAVPAPVPVALRAPVAPEGPDSIAAPPLYPWFPSEVQDSQLQRESRIEDEEPDLDSVSFVRHARRQAVWRQPLVRVLLVLVMLLLAGLLALQYAVLERDKLAAVQPALRPWLQLLCGPLRCEVRPPRQIDAIVIDSSSFSRLRSDAYRLGFSVRNQAPLPVAMPSIELTLTDSQDQPVLRRVLAPADVGAAATLPAAGESTSSVALAIAANGSGNRIAGYRLLAFYP